MLDYLAILFRREFYIWRHYRIRFLNLLLFPVIIILENILKGTFVGKIVFYNKYISYFYFLIFSFIFYEIFEQSFNFILKIIKEKKRVIEFVFIGLKKYTASRILYVILETYMYLLPLIALVLLFFSKNTFTFVISVLLASLICIPGIAFAFFLYPLIIKFRGKDVVFIRRTFSRFSPILVPAQFSFYIFPKSEILEILLPSVGIVEEVRKLAFLNLANFNVLLYSILVSLAYLMIGSFLFYWVLNKARREGWIGLV